MVGRFVTDTSLASLGRRLRLLGYDVVIVAAGGLERICRVARDERRIVLTMSRRVPAACAFAERYVVARAPLEAGVKDVVSRFEPAGPPFSRCSHCNEPLVAVTPEEVGRAPIAPPANVELTGRCPSCHRWYWHGSHVDHLREWMVRAGC